LTFLNDSGTAITNTLAPSGGVVRILRGFKGRPVRGYARAGAARLCRLSVRLERFAAMRDRYHAWNAAMKPASQAKFAFVYGKSDMR
jgi:hypothetical protein